MRRAQRILFDALSDEEERALAEEEGCHGCGVRIDPEVWSRECTVCTHEFVRAALAVSS